MVGPKRRAKAEAITDAPGAAVLGPITVAPGDRFNVLLEPENHSDVTLQLRIGEEGVALGENNVLVYVVKEGE